MRNLEKRVLGREVLDPFLARLTAMTDAEFEAFEVVHPEIRRLIGAICLDMKVNKDERLLTSEPADAPAALAILLTATTIEWPVQTTDFNWVGVHRIWNEFVTRFGPQPKLLPAHMEELVAA